MPLAGLRSLSFRDLVRAPGLISLSRIPLAALFPLALRRPRRAIALLATAGATDLLDGWVARTFHQESVTGAIVDGVSDKVFALTVIGCLARAGYLSAPEIVLLGTRELGEIALAVRLGADRRRRGRLRDPTANVFGKRATTLQYAALAAVIVRSPLRRALIAAAGALGVAASIAYWQREARRAGA